MTISRCLTLLFLAFLLNSAPVTAQVLSPVPDSDSLNRVEEQVEELFGEDIANATTSTARARVIEQFLDTASEPNANPTECFVLLRRAQQMSVADGDVKLAMRSASLFTERFKSDRLSVFGNVLTKLSATASNSTQRLQLVAECEKAATNAMTADRVEQANRFLELGIKSAKRCRALELANKLSARKSGLQELVNAKIGFQKAMDRLKDAPDDPNANLRAGQFLCFAKSKWTEGLALLIKSEHPLFISVAELEHKPFATRAQKFAIADAWWKSADQSKDNRLVYEGCLLRAGSWYRAAAEQDSLTGLTKMKVDRRIAIINRLDRPIPILETIAAPSPVQATIPVDQPIRGFQMVASQRLPTAGKASAMRFTADSESLFVSSADGLHRINTEKPTIENSVQIPDLRTSAIRLSSDGTKLITV